jgi:hypothetical protein
MIECAHVMAHDGGRIRASWENGMGRGDGQDVKRDTRRDLELDEAADTASGKPSAARTARRNRFRLIAAALAVVALLIGVASYGAASLLGDAVRASARRGAETPAALAATVCSDLIHQDYSDLMARIDTAAAPPAVTSSFDAQALTQRLHALDAADGPVSSCAATPLSASEVALPAGPDGATRLLLTLGRAGTPLPIAAVLITRLSPEGAWVVERDSSFLLAS